jgi:ABC-type branched-subunit amino acid transport system substrate-binding protein
MQRIRAGATLAFVAVIAVLSVRCACAADLVVAHIGPSSGPDAAVSRAFGEGAQRYFQRVNLQGGIAGVRITLASKVDSEEAATSDIEAALRAEKPLMVIGAVGSEGAMKLIPSLERLQIPLLGPLVQSKSVVATNSPFVFRIGPEPAQEIEALLTEVHSLGFRKIALCASLAALHDYRSRAHRPQLPAGFSPIATERCDGSTAQIESAADAIAATRAQAVVFSGSTHDAVIFISALRARGSYAMVVATSSVDSETLARSLPASARVWLAVAESMPSVLPAGPVGRTSIELLDLARSRGPLSRATLAGFVTAKLAVEAIRRAGPNASGANVRSVLAGMQRYDVGGIAFDFSNEPRDASYTRLTIVNGRGQLLN